jgi:GAF domain-containing protein
MSNSRDDVPEGNLLRHLLGLSSADDLERALEEGLQLIKVATNATAASVEVDGDAARFRTVCGDVDTLGRGVVSHAFLTGTTIHSASARKDPRFRNLESVRSYAIDAVVCSPFEVERPRLMGAVYIQRSKSVGAFSERQRALVVLFAMQLALLAERLVRAQSVAPASLQEETRRFQERLVREVLVRTNGNIAQAARELRISRTFVYRLSPLAKRRRQG